MDASDIRLQTPATSEAQPLSTIYEVCICQNSGKIFVAPSVADMPSNCASQQTMCV